MRRLVKIPFSGFYNSVHDALLEPCVDMFESVDEYDEYCDSINWQKTHGAYTREYCNRYNDGFFYKHGLMIEPTFKELQSPKYYNFETDVIYATINVTGLAQLARETGFEHWLHVRMMPRDGFIPFYSNVLSDWDTVVKWDSNQWGLVLEFLHDGENVYVDNAQEYIICK